MNEFVPCFQNLNGFQKRQARHSIFQNICRSKGYNGLSWTCPTCGKGDHGQPTGHGFCISTSSVEHWAGLALDESDLRLGFDLAHRNAPQEANGIAELFLALKKNVNVLLRDGTMDLVFQRSGHAKKLLVKCMELA